MIENTGSDLIVYDPITSRMLNSTENLTAPITSMRINSDTGLGSSQFAPDEYRDFLIPSSHFQVTVDNPKIRTFAFYNT